ncbi:MAG: hypothetical protein ACI92G_002153 [Candidatus Pelagisphaera sp.]|jgi:hypothetical protein
MHFLHQAFCGTMLAIACGESATTRISVNRPNILFIITDDQSWEHVGAYDDQAVRTPAMDRLAKNGILFENTFPTGFNHYHTRLMIAFNVQFVV